MAQLLDGATSEEEEEYGDGLQVNQKYASRMEHNRRREELQKLQEKRNRGELDSDDESSEDEDSEGELLTTKVDMNIHKAIAMIKKKDPSIYDQNVNFFEDGDFEQHAGDSSKSKKAQKPMHLRDYERKVLLEDEGKIDSDEELMAKPISLEEEQRKIKADFLKEANDDEENEGDGGVFKKRTVTIDERAAADKDFKTFQLERGQYLDEYFGTADKRTAADNFLHSYLDNEGWRDDEGANNVWGGDLIDVDDILPNPQKAEAAPKYRFQEEGADTLQSHPRQVRGSVRAGEPKRKKQRQEKKKRVEEKKARKAEELKRLKALKRQEISDRLKKIKSLAGADNLGIDESILEEDWDPDAYDQSMQAAFDDDYYDAAPDDHGDAEALLQYDEDDMLGPFPASGGGGKSGFEAIVEQAKKAGAGAEVENMLDRYYGLEYEDLVGDLPTRFKYRQTERNNFGIDVLDIFTAPDTELNRHASIKRLAPYRTKRIKNAKPFVRQADDAGGHGSAQGRTSGNKKRKGKSKRRAGDKSKVNRAKRKETGRGKNGGGGIGGGADADTAVSEGDGREGDGDTGQVVAENELRKEKKRKKVEVASDRMSTYTSVKTARRRKQRNL